MKSEPSVFSFEDLKAAQNKTEPWDGIRNYQARNFMMNDMRVGDEVLFYHSSCKEPGVAGLAAIASEAYPDPTAWDKKSDYFDPKSTPEKPRWFMVDVKWKADLPRYIPLSELRETQGLETMKLLQRGQRLSIQPVTSEEFKIIQSLAKR